MDIKDILSKVDHTLLAPDSTWAQIEEICDDGVKFGTASVCIPQTFVKRAKDYLWESLPVCTVIGFPCGYLPTAVKVLEAKNAVRDGAREIDMVIDIGALKEKRYGDVLADIKAVREATEGNILKVIIETCLLTDAQKVEMCKIVSASGADFIKTSTGFSKGGTTFADIELFAKNVEPHLKIKAAGGISSLDDAKRFIELGASRLGTSRIVKILKENNNDTDTAY